MGNVTKGQSTTGKTAVQKGTEQIVRDACQYSGHYQTPCADNISYAGLSAYLNLEAGKAMSWRPVTSDERIAHYRAVEKLSSELGMSDGHRLDVLKEGYGALNGSGRTKHLENAHIPAPSLARPTDAAQASSSAPAASSSAPAQPEHAPKTVEDLDTLLANPRSYVSLSGQKREHLLTLQTNRLAEVVNADSDFVAKSGPYWNLEPSKQQATADHVSDNFNAELCHKVGAAFATNALPSAAFVAGKDAAMNAVHLGYNLYGQDASGAPAALKLFGQAAVAINLAANPQTTMAGRGVDSIQELSMGFSPDGHSNAPMRRH
ncbi:hypothetical protein LVB77_14465 [Lysobacter sp. 5GHs7-4]|uniref:hypothetical protein n=1 Tax=Lysobacter sp. 5GHs7-4 TaxID=2904253 RepID=UPI001E54A805|nr:hypothetical protein [Lysobacter sp. 5GHs7-4]UHQ21869.1 hypothetical protein LVB77_14465 [Lysobacter sp. 5GHs7-4]